MHDTNLLEDQPIAWTPTPEVIERSQLARFMKQVNISTWDELYKYSISDVERFTEDVLKFLDIKFDPSYEKLLDTANGPELPRWFQRRGDTSVDISGSSAHTSPDLHSSAPTPSERQSDVHEDKSVLAPSAGLNITTMCLDRWVNTENEYLGSIIWEGENGETKDLSASELLFEVQRLAASLRNQGFRKGDAIGIHLPMLVETVVSLLAINRIGAIAVPVFSGYGIDAISSRMEAVKAKGLITCFGTTRRGKPVDMLTVAARAVANVSSIKSIYVIGKITRSDLNELRENLFHGRELLSYEIEIERKLNMTLGDPEPTAAEDPLIILYTSGTTGKPKGIAHTHASFPIKAAQDMAFGTDVGKGTRICWYTDLGWMMGPWLIYGALINGATICLYDGAPDYPTPDRMWEFCSRHKVEILGISPTLIRALARSNDTPVANSGSPADTSLDPHSSPSASSECRNHVHQDKSVLAPYERHDLSSLRAFASTGEPWNPGPWWWLFEKVGNSKLPIINYSGGTEISGGILMGNPLLPIKPCSFPAPCLGMDVDILDEEGIPVPDGKVGELVIKQPWIGMARGFWQETERYLDAYWRRFPNIWVHGDWAMRDKGGHWFILGRSDDTLKVAGKRVGPAEVESILVAHPRVTEAAVIGIPDPAKGTAMVAFVVLRSDDTPLAISGSSSDTPSDPTPHERRGDVHEDKSVLAPLEADLKALVAKDMGKPLAPSKIHIVPAIPKTRNAKVMRRVIRSAYLSEDPGDLSALENPTAVDAIAAIRK